MRAFPDEIIKSPNSSLGLFFSRAVLFLVIVLSFFQSCSSQKNSRIPSEPISVTEEERIWLTEFFRDLLFKNPGAYTLYGTKPISTSCICYYNDNLTEEEREKLWRDNSDAVAQRYPYKANYQKWQKIKHRFHIRQYLFGSFPSPFVDDAEVVFFVNIEMTIRMLLDFYEDFRRVLGYEFDPFQIVFEIEHRDSKFWNAILKEHALQGILLGYGVGDSWFFEWKMKYLDAQDKMGDFMRSLPTGFDSDETIEDYGPQNFTLPIFRIFGLHQNVELVKRYEKERERIKQLYKGKNEVDVALEWLTR